MQEAQNTKLVQDVYAAFGRGDIQTLLGHLDNAVVWRPIYGAGKQVPTSGEWAGRAAVAEFFRVLAEKQTFESFEPRDFISQGDKVVVLVHYVGGPKATTKRFASDWTMVFTVRDGKVVHFQEFCDSAAINAAWDGASH